MRRIKLVLTVATLFFIAAMSVVFNACNQDPCKEIVCKNNGTCREGVCKCSLGYEGPFCATKMYEKYIGTWDGYYRCNGLLPEVRTLVIAPEVEPNRVSIYNLFDQNLSMLGTVDNIYITLDEQVVGNFKYTGNGYIDGKYVTIFVQQRNLTDSVFSSCVYNGLKFTEP